MKEYEFTLKFTLDNISSNAEDYISSLEKEGCDDATIGIGKNGCIALLFNREANDAKQAVISAINNVVKAIPNAKLIDARLDSIGISMADMKNYINNKKFSLSQFVLSIFFTMSFVSVATAASATLMNNSIYTNCQNQVACDAAQNGTYAGAAVGTAASVGTLVASGAGTAGLSAIGGVVGGGMVAGTIAVLAAPIAVTAIVGGAVYWLFSDDESE